MRVLSEVLLLAMSLVGFCEQQASAEAIPAIFVEGETDDPSMQQCKLSYSSAIAATQAAFRYNRVSIGSSDDYIQDKAFRFYVNINAFEITRGNKIGTGSCVVSLSAFLGTGTKTPDPVNRNFKWATIHYCDRGGLFVLDMLNTQTRVNTELAQYVNQCISAYEEMKVYS